jgi:acyl-CoA thioesterase I
VLWEFPYVLSPRLPPSPAARVTVIGDSVSAGMGDGEAVTWPELLRRRHGLEVIDYSHVGETAETAVKRLEGEPLQPGIVLIEVGGNDLLGDTSPQDFERALGGLLRLLRHEERQLVMFELPLPPLYNRFGRIQRRLARAHGVALIPKRIFMDVLLSSETTLDTIHLNQAGHERMADRVWEIVAPAVDDAKR